MAYASASPGGYGGGPTVIHTDASHADAVSISDAELLFTGHLERKGPDLFLTGHDGHRHIIPAYFAAEHHADLVAPNGARITGDLVDLLAGSAAPGQYAQAQATVPTGAIGRIEKAVGDVTVMRNGVSVALHVGDAVYKNDVVQTGADSSAGIGFPDGTALNLVSNTRMALNDYVYDPNGTSNDALFNLVQGGFAFVAGKVAHTGDMKIGTPVATMGIRGTTGYALEQVATVSANVGNVTMSFAVVADPGGNGRVGAYVLTDQFGNEVAVDRAGIWTTLSWNGPNVRPTVTTQPMTAANYAIEQALVPALVQILNNINNLSPNPQSGPNNPGSSTPPMFELINLQQYLQQNGNTQTVNIQTGGSNSNTQNEVSATFTFTPGIPATSVVTWTSPVSGTWETATNWNDLSSPTAPQYVSINQPVKVTVQGSESAYGLRIGAGATLNIASGATLEVSGGIADFGRLQLNSTGSDPTLAINGTVYLLNNGTLALVGPTHENRIIGVAGTAATLVNVNNTITGSGTIGKGDGTLTLVNGKDGTIEATPLLASDTGLLIIDTGNTDSNSGLFAAAAAGMLQIDDAVTNLGFIQAQADSTILIADRIHNRTGTISADGAGANVDLDKAVIHHGTVASRDGGIIATTHGQSTFVDVSIANNSTLETHQASSLDLRGTTTIDGTVTFEGQGRFELHHQAAIVGGSQHAELDNFGTIAGAGNIGGGDANFVLVNELPGTIDASGQRTLTIDNDSPGTAGTQPGNAVINTGTIEATGSGGLTIENTTISNATEAAHDTGHLDVLAGSHINLDNATILHGFVSIAAGGEMLTVSGTSNTVETSYGQDNVSTVTISNAGMLGIGDGSSLTLASPDAIDNAGTISLNSTGGATHLYFDQPDAGIAGGGQIILSADVDNVIAVTQSGDRLTNFDNAISGAGTIGAGGMVLINHAVINADQQNAALTLEPAFLANTGTLEATNNATLVLNHTTVSNSSATTDPGVNYAFTTLNDPAATGITGAAGINDAGQVVGSYFAGGNSNGFLYNGSSYVTLDDPAATGGTSANAINGSGEVVGTYFVGGTQSGFLFDNGIYTALNDPVGTGGTLANGINNAGQIVGEYLDAHGSPHGFLFSAGAYTTLDDPLGVNGTDAKGINDAGEVVGYYLDSSSVAHGYLYSNGTYTALNDPAAAGGTYAEGINDAGEVVGYYLDASDVAHGFIYSNGKYVNFDDSSAGTGAGQGTLALAINDAGQASGYSVGSDFDVTGFRADPARSPAFGTIVAHAGTTIDLVGTSIVGGAVNIAGILDSTGTSFITNATITNTGTIEATSGELTVDPSTVTNTGTLGAADGATLVLNNTIVSGTGGTIDAGIAVPESSGPDNGDDGDGGGTFTLYDVLEPTSLVNLEGVTITGGTIKTSSWLGLEGGPPDYATSIVQTVTNSDGGASTSTFDGVTIEGYVQVNDNTTLTLRDTINNEGQILLASATDGANLAIDGRVTLTGGGTITLLSSTSNLIGSSGPGNILENVNNFIGGAGYVGGNLKLINDAAGVIQAASAEMIVDTGNHAITNAGLLLAISIPFNESRVTIVDAVNTGGILEIKSNVDNSGGAIAAVGANCVVELFDVTITGGVIEAGNSIPYQDYTLEAVGSGSIVVVGAAILNDVTLTSSGTLTIDSGATLTLSHTTVTGGAIDDAGTLSISADSEIKHATVDGGGDITVASDQTLTFGAVTLDNVTLVGSFSNAGATLTIDDTVTLNGATITGGIIDVAGILDSTGTGFITDATITNTGTIAAAMGTLTIDPSTVTNTGTLEATSGGEFVVFSPVNNSGGTVGAYSAGYVDLQGTIAGGSAIINGGTLEYGSSASVATSFNGPGALVLDGTNETSFHAGTNSFTGVVSGFGDGDIIDLTGIPDTVGTILSYNQHTDLLTVSNFLYGDSVNIQLSGNYSPLDFLLLPDGSGTDVTFTNPIFVTNSYQTAVANTYSVNGTVSFADLDFHPQYSPAFTPDGTGYVGDFSLQLERTSFGGEVQWNFTLGNDQINLAPGETLTQSYQLSVSDGQGSTLSETASISIGGPGKDNFVFHPGIGADTIVNFNSANDTVELDHFANIQSVQQLTSLITNDPHGDAVIALGHNDSITLPGVSANYLQAHLHSLVHLG